MATSAFVGARLKVARARKHTRDLEGLIGAYDGAWLVPTRQNIVSILFVMRVYSPPSDQIPVVLGDAVHNLRVALDHLAVTTVTLGGRSAKGVHFPFSETSDDLDLMIKNKKFDRAPPEAVELLRSLKPYRGGNAALRAIHDLDLLDKHNELIPTYGAGVLDPFVYQGHNFGNVAMALVDGAPYFGFATTQPIGPPMPLVLEAGFGEGHPFAHQPVVPVLDELSELVDNIIASFEAIVPA